jgi:hypothetical protein
MYMSSRKNAVDGSAFEKTVPTLFFLLPIFFLSIRGWSNTIFFLIVILLLTTFSRDIKFYFSGRNKNFWFVLALFAIPILSEMVAQVGRLSINLASFDGPVRFLLSGLVFVYVSRAPSALESVSGFSKGCVLGALTAFLSIICFKESYWGERAATYFVDPNNLALNALFLLLIGSFWLLWRERSVFTISICIAHISIVGYVVFQAQSRAVWLSVLIIIQLTITRFFWKNKLALLVLSSLFWLGIYLIFEMSPLASERIAEVISDYKSFQLGDAANSVGFRLNLLKMDWALLALSPLFGYADQALPSFIAMRQKLPYLDYETYNMFVVAGAHSEIFAQLVRKGILVGSATLVATIFYPCYVFLKGLGERETSINGFSFIGFLVVVALLVNSFSIEVFNIKMNVTFFGVFLALSFGLISPERPRTLSSITP